MENIISSLILVKFLCGAFLGISFCFWAFFSRDFVRRRYALRGALFLALFFGGVGVIFPIIIKLYVNLFFLTFLQILILSYVGKVRYSNNRFSYSFFDSL